MDYLVSYVGKGISMDKTESVEVLCIKRRPKLSIEFVWVLQRPLELPLRSAFSSAWIENITLLSFLLLISTTSLLYPPVWNETGR